jgi:hypothetical protein
MEKEMRVSRFQMDRSTLKKLFIAFALVLAIVSIAKPFNGHGVQGDGFEYILMSHAFIERGGPSLVTDDCSIIAQKPGNSGQDFTGWLATSCPASLKNIRAPFFQGRDGVYSYHFWLYSMISAPFMYLARAFGRPDTVAFPITNTLFVALTILSILFVFKGTALQKACIVVGFMTAGTQYYINWTHPEVFTASLGLIGLILLRNSSNKLGAFCLALAGQQNPPFLLLLPIVLLLDTVKFRTDKAYGWRTFVSGWAIVGCVSALSVAFQMFEFGTPNLISKYASDYGLLSAQRVFWLYFDPNTGGFYHLPMLLAAFIAVPYFAYMSGNSRSVGLFFYLRNSIGKKLVCLGINQKMREREQIALEGRLSWILLFALMSLILATPSTVNFNFNPGLEGIHRYSYWIFMPLIMLFGELAGSVLRGRKIFIFSLLVVQVIWASYLYRHRGSYVNFSTLERIALDQFPGLYNPIPETFIERGQKRESHSSNLFYLWIYDGHINKALFNGKDKITLLPKCQDGSELAKHVESVKKRERGWRYWNLDGNCRVMLADGFLSSEAFGKSTWSGCDLAHVGKNATKNRETCEIRSRSGSDGVVSSGPYFTATAGTYRFEIEYTGNAPEKKR